MIFPESGLRKVAGVCGLLTVFVALAIAAASPNPEAVTATPTAATSAPAPASAPSGPPSIKACACDIHDVDDAGALPLISIIGARNGSFSGKAVVDCSGAVQGLKATLGELRLTGETARGGPIPASAVTIRYGVEWDSSFRGRYRPKGRDILLDQPPATPAGKVPVWLTVHVPKDAKGGTYAADLTIEAKGVPAVKVPVNVVVQDWKLPDPQDYRTVIDIIQSPDTLSLEYGPPLYSPKHWDLIAQSLRLISPTGMRMTYLPLICQTNHGNEQSMVRWIKKGEGPDGAGQYDYDFTVFDKYLDLVEKELGKPKIVVLYAWDVLLTTPKGTEPADGDTPYQKGEKERLMARAEQAKKGIPVTLLDPASGKCETINVPGYAKGSEDVAVSVAHVRPARADGVTLRSWPLDEEHATWWTAWQADVAARKMSPKSFKTTAWTLNLPGELADPADVEFWKSRAPEYAKLGQLHSTDEHLRPVANDTIAWPARLKPNAVVLYELFPVEPVGPLDPSGTR